MRISTKLVIGLSLVSTSILGTYGYWQYRQEEKDLRAAAERDFRVLSTAVVVAVENSVRDRQTADIREILDSLEVREPEIDVFVVDGEGRLTADSFTSSTPEQTALAAADDLDLRRVATSVDAQPVVRFEGRRNSLRLVGVFPLWNDDRVKVGALAIVRPLEGLRSDLRWTFISTVASSLTLIAGITGVSWLLIVRYVRRPLARLVVAMRAVRGGDLSASMPPLGADELGAMAVEFNAMIRQLAQARRQLLEAAESREALEGALQRADKLVTVGQLSAGLAHEIGSPLQILSGRARALAARTDLPPDVSRTARILDEQSDRITRIVEQLLSFARRKTTRVGEVDLGGPIAVIVDLLAGEARRRGVQLEFERPQTLPPVMADADQVQQVVMNLLNNALRATPSGGRVRVVLAASSFDTADGASEQPSVALRVEDSGPGIAAPLLERIFEPFFTTWSSAGGTGLGLSVVKSIVDEHGGTIHVSSEQDQGASFVVHFPSTARARARGQVA